VKAIAIRPGEPGSLHRREIHPPDPAAVPAGRGVRLRMLQVGLCGTDHDLAEGRYGVTPDGEDHLVIGHESLGRVIEVGSGVPDVTPGQLAVVTIRRPGSSPYDQVGLQDLTTDAVFIERGISRHHGFLAEEVVDSADYLVPVPDHLAGVAILTEPLSCITKALRQADEIQARLRIWQPARALVLGSGPIGLLTVMALRLRGLDVTCYSRRAAPTRNSLLVERIGGRYVSVADADLAATTRQHGPFDLVFEGSGAPSLVLPAASALAVNGVLVLFSVSPGSQVVEVDIARLNHALVLGNRAIVGSVTGTWQDYADAVSTLDRALTEPVIRDWLPELITDRIAGFDAVAIAEHLAGRRDAIKAVVDLE
jgi:threonine dehydrogenase-like Zn-dependent dehydrogenase